MQTPYNYDSYCGIYCGACDIHVAYATGKKSQFASFFTGPTLKALISLRGIAFQPSDLELKCHGCKSDTLFINCSDCPIRTCAVAQKVEHCIDCSDYPCKILKTRQKMENMLPHLTTNHENMVVIREHGLDQWLGEQSEKWKCPECQTRFTWYARRCTSCNKDLKDRAFKFSRVKAAILKTAIHLSSFAKGKSKAK